MIAVIIVPKWRTTPWFKLLRNFRLGDELATTEYVFTCLMIDGIDGKRQDVGPARWTTQFYVDDTDGVVRFLPHNNLHTPRRPIGLTRGLVTNGIRV
jgi:hypothetical protein